MAQNQNGEYCEGLNCDTVEFPSLPMQTVRTGVAVAGDAVIFSGNPAALGTDANPSPIATELATQLAAGAVPIVQGDFNQSKLNAAIFSKVGSVPQIRLNTSAANFNNLVVGMTILDTKQGTNTQVYRAIQFLSPEQYQNQVLDLVDPDGNPIFAQGKCVAFGILVPTGVQMTITMFFGGQYFKAPQRYTPASSIMQGIRSNTQTYDTSQVMDQPMIVTRRTSQTA